MIRSPLAIRIDAAPDRPIKPALREAAALGVKGVVLEAIGDLSPDRLSETGRRDLRHALRSAELALAAMALPTRRGFDTADQLEDRLARADRAFALAFELGTRTVVVRAGGVPPESDAARRQIFASTVGELARRADRHGIRLALETGPDPGQVLREALDAWDIPLLAASVDPAGLLTQGHDPVASTLALGPWVVHAYATDASAAGGNVEAANPRGFGYRPGVLDWEEYLGALEEIGYAGYLTLWPDVRAPIGPQITPLIERLRKF